MTPTRSLVIAMLGMFLLIGNRPIAGDDQFPRGLMASADPRTPNRSCTIETRALSFGVYDTLAETDLDAIGQIIYTCENGNGGGPGRAKPPEQQGIRIEVAQGYGNSFAPRRMLGLGGSRLEYNIYLDATRRMVWGTGEGPTQVYIDSNPPNRTPVIVPAFGRIFGRQEVEAGPYTDDVPVRILF
jgi:spore coat protein U-like protein